MKTRQTIAASAIALAALGASTANAATVYDALGDFTLSNPSGPWAYGFGNPATGNFTAMTTSGTAFGGHAGLNYWQGVPVASDVPVVIHNISGAAVNIGTPYVPTDALLIHPAQNSEDPNSNVIVEFIAPTASSYSYSGFYELLDNNPSGVIGQIYAGTTQLYTGTLTSPAANSTVVPYTPGASETFGGTVYLHAGDTLSFTVNNDGNYFFDSTGFDATISAVPEPATWAMMLAGFGAVGFMMRGSLRRKTGAAVTA
jgi:hypothetical protein